MGVKKNYILASGSKDRFALLGQVGFEPESVHSPDIDETPFVNERPSDYVMRMALEKAKAVSEKFKGRIVLSADAIVVADDMIIQKAYTEEEQTAVMNRLSGKTHFVLTAICVADGKGVFYQELCPTEIKTLPMTAEEITAYVKSHDWEGCSGYKAEGLMAGFIEKINGSYSGLIGMPQCEARRLLLKAGVTDL